MSFCWSSTKWRHNAVRCKHQYDLHFWTTDILCMQTKVGQMCRCTLVLSHTHTYSQNKWQKKTTPVHPTQTQAFVVTCHMCLLYTWISIINSKCVGYICVCICIEEVHKMTLLQFYFTSHAISPPSSERMTHKKYMPSCQTRQTITSNNSSYSNINSSVPPSDEGYHQPCHRHKEAAYWWGLIFCRRSRS